METNKKVFVTSNSFSFKNSIKKRYNTVVTQEIVKEEIIGNHYNYNKVFYDNIEINRERTESVIIDMMFLSDSNLINFFTLWGRDSNFLILSKLNGTPIRQYYVN